jgi:protein-S-isoprenylcysteine O-methyltransferase Ste14
MGNVTWTALAVIWVSWILLWVIWAIGNKRSSRSESLLQNATHMVPLMLACLLLAAPKIPFNLLCGAFLPASLRGPAQPLGLVLTVVGLWLTIWSRRILGGNWSGEVAIKPDHQLIERGPYALVRHPIYTGLLLAMLGSGLAWGEWRGLIAPLIGFVSFWWKLRQEEIWLSEHFGAAYRGYMSRTRALIPYFI